MEKEFDDEFSEEGNDIYDEEVVEELEENDEIDPDEGAFMEGYMKEDKPKKKLKKKKKTN